jgi:mono/diheme cytochrome c family protein
MKFILIILSSLSIITSCNYSKIKKTAAPTTDNPSASITDSQWLTENLFQAKCASCHNSGRQPGGYKFETEKDLLDNVVKKSIIAGSPSTSSLYKIIESGAMPPRGDKATATELSVLECWITGGATAESTACVQKFGLSGTAKPGGNPGPTAPTTGNGNGSGSDNGGDDNSGDDNSGDDNSGDDNSGDDDNGDDNSGDDNSGDDNGSDDNGSDGNGNDDNGDAGGTDGTGGTDGGVDGGQTPGMKFSEIQAPIFATSCVACHGAESPAAGVNLESMETIKNPPTGPKLVQCGNADASLLYTIVATDQMPAFSDPLSAELKQKLKSWINDGCQP